MFSLERHRLFIGEDWGRYFSPVASCSPFGEKLQEPVACWEVAASWEGTRDFKMAARSIFRAVPLCRRNIAFIAGSSRTQSIFTKYREPPNGFLFNEKVNIRFSNGFGTLALRLSSCVFLCQIGKGFHRVIEAYVHSCF